MLCIGYYLAVFSSYLKNDLEILSQGSVPSEVSRMVGVYVVVIKAKILFFIHLIEMLGNL